MRKPRALRPGDRIAVVAPASAFARHEFEAGIAELRALGFEPTYEESVFERRAYLAGPADVRASAWLRAWTDPSIAALIAVRGGFGSVQLLPALSELDFDSLEPKAFIGYSDNTSILSWLTTHKGIVTIHGPMLEGRLAHGDAGYDRDTFLRCVCRPEPIGEISHPQTETLRPGECAGMLVGGTLTQLVGSLGTPYAFDPPAGCVLFLDEVAERPYRLDRLLMQLKLSGLLRGRPESFSASFRAATSLTAASTRATVVRESLAEFPGPVLFGLPSGHTAGATITLPLGVRARVVANDRPLLVIEESAVE